MKKIKFITLLLTIIFLTPSLTFADTPYFLDFKYILNKSTAGNKAQVFLKNKLENGIKKIQVKEKEMPLNSYTWVHRDAKLTDDERVVLTHWAQSVMDTMKAKYPLDSLIRKKN